jgi:hypothetical protein
MLNPNIAKKLFKKVGTPYIDLFASTINKQAHFYYRKPNSFPAAEGCLGDNAFDFEWNEERLYYANPLWCDVEKVVKKVHIFTLSVSRVSLSAPNARSTETYYPSRIWTEGLLRQQDTPTQRKIQLQLLVVSY